MRRRTNAAQIDVERLESTSTGDWLTPAERERIGALVDAARGGDRRGLQGLAPGAVYPGVLIADCTEAVHVVERMTVAHRRRLAGAKYAAATGESHRVVAERLRLGYLSRDDELRFLATRTIA